MLKGLRKQPTTKHVGFCCQQRRLVDINATNNAGRALNAHDSAAMAAAQQQNVINSRRKVRATGRIVLEMPVDANSISQLPDLSLA